MRAQMAVFPVTLALVFHVAAPSARPADLIDPAKMNRASTVDQRFQAYNIEMVEVTGGRFWRPYRDVKPSPGSQRDTRTSASKPAAMNADLYEYRPPVNLYNARLRKLAAALGPTYVRVSGTWANTTYFADREGAAPATPPKGFNSVLTREQWKGVIDFAQAVDAKIVTSFAASAGVRDAQGVWTPEQARAFLAYTKSADGRIAAAEFINEANLSPFSGLPKGYDAAAYAKDMAAFRPFLKTSAPEITLLGPGSVAEGKTVLLPPNLGILRSEDLLKATGPVYDAFSYHLYPAVSQRCGGMSPDSTTTAEAALTPEWLARPDAIQTFYADLRDRFEPGKPLWITETADASCGGNPWASTFLDTFRYLDEHGRLARAGVQVVMHNTLAASDYGLLEDATFAPRPNYWAALLWRRFMGRTVLKPQPTLETELPLYAHCASGQRGVVALLAININRDGPRTLNIAGDAKRYTLTAAKLEGTSVALNGKELRLGADDSLPELPAVQTRSGSVTLPPASITFLVFENANNKSCQSS